MDPFQLLQQDHNSVISLFAEYRKAEGGPTKHPFFDLIKAEVLLHARIEEQAVYPVFKQYQELQPLIEESYEEHRKVEQMLQIMSDQTSAGGSFVSHMLELEKNIEHHVQEEESQVFPKAKQALSQEQQQKLADDITSLKQTLAPSLESAMASDQTGIMDQTPDGFGPPAIYG